MRRVVTACVAALFALGLTTAAGCADSGAGNGEQNNQQEPESNGADAEDDAADNGGQGAGNDTDEGLPDEQNSGPAEGEPDLVGKGLGIANDEAEKAGFDTDAYDSTGRNRTPVVARNWQVCFQEAARAEEDTEIIRLGVVPTDEDCPDEDRSRTQPELGDDNELPDFAGSNLQVATDALGSSASVDPVDAQRDRRIYIPQNWKVCDQSLDPGTRWDGAPITFQVVKYGERCP